MVFYLGVQLGMVFRGLGLGFLGAYSLVHLGFRGVQLAWFLGAYSWAFCVQLGLEAYSWAWFLGAYSWAWFLGAYSWALFFYRHCF